MGISMFLRRTFGVGEVGGCGFESVVSERNYL